MQNAPRPQPPLEELARRTEGMQPWRRALHLVGGSLVAWMVFRLSPQSASARLLVGSMLTCALLGDLLRLRWARFNRFAFRTFSALLVPREVARPSLTWFLLGVFIVLWLPDEAGAVPSLLVLAVADPAASVAGRLWGRRRLGKGTVEGSVAFVVAAVLVLTPFVGVWTALPVAVAAAVAEVFPWRLDDNTVIPVVTALSLWAMASV